MAAIDSANARKVTRGPNGGETISVQPGDRWRGLYRFDTVTATNARIATLDRLESTTAPQLLSGSIIAGNNQAAPVIDMIKISLTAGALGPSLIGTAGAVADVDQPITVFARNENSG